MILKCIWVWIGLSDKRKSIRGKQIIQIVETFSKKKTNKKDENVLTSAQGISSTSIGWIKL